MATIQRGQALADGFTAEPKARSLRPVLWWAATGLLLLVFQIVVMSRWIFGPTFVPTDPGPDPIPAWQSAMLTALQIAVPVAAVVLLYLWIVRPWRQKGYLTTDAMIALAASTVFFWDMVMNYSSVTLFYNSHLINRGAWANGAWPTWISPNANRLPEPLLIVPPAYTALVYSQVIIVLSLIRKVRARWPGLGVAGIVGAIVVGLTISDTLVEGLVLRTGVYAYPGGIRAITLFAGQTYQIPLSETLLFGGLGLGAIACLSHFRDDHGQTFVERGISTLTLSVKARQLVKFFAIYGAIHLSFVVLYMVPQQFFALHSGPFPQGYPSYMVNDMCASGADGKTCPGPGVPMPRPPYQPQ